MLCSKCGVDNEDAARFCRACGAKIECASETKTNESIIDFEDSYEPAVTMSNVASSVGSTNNSNAVESKKYLLLLCIAPATLVVWSIISRVFWSSYSEVLNYIYNIFDAALWGILHASLSITIWKRSKSFILLWSGIYLASAVIYVIIGNGAVAFELMYTIAMICSGLIVFGIKRCTNNVQKEEIVVALSACASIFFMTLATPLIFSIWLDYGYHFSIGYYTVIELIAGFAGIYIFKKVRCFE